MSRKADHKGPAAVSSTPFPKRAVSRLLKDAFENQSLSPIPVPKATVSAAEQSIPYSTFQRDLNTKASSTIGPVKPQKRKHVSQKKDSATSKALKELKQDKVNNLYHSRNLYTMHPELVVVDSDDEEMVENSEVSLKKQVPTKKQDTKKQKLNRKTALDSGAVDESDNMETAEPTVRPKRSKTTESTVTKPTSTVTKPTSTVTKPTSTVTKPTSRKVLGSVNNMQKYAKPSSANPKTESKSKPYNFDEIESLFNLDSLDEEEDCNNDVPKTHPNVSPLLDNAGDKNSVPLDVTTSKVNDITNNISSFVEIINGKEKTFTRQLHGGKTVRKQETSISPNFPKDCVSKFNEVIFKANRRCGAIVAQALHTQNVDFGYVEITKNQTFLGTCPKVTFVMIEGEVNLSQGEKKETLIPGDMLHITQEQEYQIENLCNRNARLMYIKELK